MLVDHRVGDHCFFERAYLDPYLTRIDISIDESEEFALKRHARFVSCLSGDAGAGCSRGLHSSAELYKAEDVVWTPR
jgi:hypothetical protein